MKKRLLYILLVIPFAANAQQVDSLHSSKAQHYFYVGINCSSVAQTVNDNFYQDDLGSQFYQNNDAITRQWIAPGIQFNYCVLENSSRRVTLLIEAGGVYYHTHFQFNNIFISPLDGSAPPYSNEIQQTQIDFNNSSLGLRASFGTHINLTGNIYLLVGFEPELLVAELGHSYYTYTAEYYNYQGNTLQISSRTGDTTSNLSALSNFNLNILLGLGFTFAKHSRHPLALELNITEGLYSTAFYESYLRRYSYELNIGYKF